MGNNSLQRCHLNSIAIPVMEIRLSHNHLIFIHTWKDSLYIETRPWPWLSQLLKEWHSFNSNRYTTYCQTSNTRHTSVGNKIVDLGCSWSIAWWRCSDYIFILDLTPGFNGLGKDNCKTRRQSSKFWDLVHFYIRDFTAVTRDLYSYNPVGCWNLGFP